MVLKRKAIIITGYGTSQVYNLQLVYEPIREHISNMFPDYDVKIAFTSVVIISALREAGIVLPSVSEVLTQLKASNYEDVVLLSTHLLPCNEYEQMKEKLLPYQCSFSHLKATLPLLSDKENIDYVVNELINRYSDVDSHTAVLLMGHGSSHTNNSVYCEINENFQNLNSNIFLATINSLPSIDDIIKIIHQRKMEKVICAPFMMVSGSHVNKDMLGDSPNSWRNILEKQFYSVVYDLRGLGQYDFIHEILVKSVLQVL